MWLIIEVFLDHLARSSKLNSSTLYNMRYTRIYDIHTYTDTYLYYVIIFIVMSYYSIEFSCNNYARLGQILNLKTHITGFVCAHEPRTCGSRSKPSSPAVDSTAWCGAPKPSNENHGNHETMTWPRLIPIDIPWFHDTPCEFSRMVNARENHVIQSDSSKPG